MSWVYLDDGFPDHPKVVAAGGDAAWLFVCSLAYVKRFDTEGHIPAGQVPRLTDRRSPAKLAARLCEVGLWEPAEDGYRIHDYHDWNRPAEARREAGRKAARARWDRTAKADAMAMRSHPDGNANASEPHVPHDAQSPPHPSTDLSSSDTSSTRPVDDDPVGAAIALLAEGDLARRQADKGPVGNRHAWLTAAKAARHRDHATRLQALHREHPDWTATILASAVLEDEQPTPDSPTAPTVAAQALAMQRNARRANGEACQACDDTGWVPDDIGTGVHPCTCPLGAFAG